MSRIGTTLQLLATEGARGAAARVGDRIAEARRRASYRTVPLDVLAELAPVAVLQVLPFPLAARLGGVPLALAPRLELERRERPVALLTLAPGGFRVEVESGGRRRAARGRLPADGLSSFLARLVGTLGARLLHVETLAGLPLDPLVGIAATTPLVLSTHDFGLFCSRVDLLEAPGGRFCGYSRDLARCARCLGHEAASRREAAARLAAGTTAFVHPSEFMRRTHLELFPETATARHLVAPPAVPLDPAPSRAPLAPPRRVAFVGQTSERKGFPDFLAAAARLRAAHPGIEWCALGGDTPEAARAARAAGIRGLGAYRARDVTRRLVAERIDLAVLPSRFPEAHALVLDACVLAGVPVVAADAGALGERARELGAGIVYEGEAEGLVAALARALADPPRAGDRGPLDPEIVLAATAHAHVALYRELRAASGTRS